MINKENNALVIESLTLMSSLNPKSREERAEALKRLSEQFDLVMEASKKVYNSFILKAVDIAETCISNARENSELKINYSISEEDQRLFVILNNILQKSIEIGNLTFDH